MLCLGILGLYINEAELIIEVVPRVWRLYSVEELISVYSDVDHSNQLMKHDLDVTSTLLSCCAAL